MTAFGVSSKEFLAMIQVATSMVKPLSSNDIAHLLMPTLERTTCN